MFESFRQLRKGKNSPQQEAQQGWGIKRGYQHDGLQHREMEKYVFPEKVESVRNNSTQECEAGISRRERHED
jgi:hypothetical protein